MRVPSLRVNDVAHALTRATTDRYVTSSHLCPTTFDHRTHLVFSVHQDHEGESHDCRGEDPFGTYRQSSCPFRASLPVCERVAYMIL